MYKPKKMVQHGTKENEAWKVPDSLLTCTFPDCNHERCGNCESLETDDWTNFSEILIFDQPL